VKFTFDVLTPLKEHATCKKSGSPLATQSNLM